MDKKKTVISASRRTDIPGCYTHWFMECIRRGEVRVKNPFNQVERVVDLRPESVHSIVLWSKNYGPFLNFGAHTMLAREGYRLFFNFTINAPNPVLEPGIPALPARLSQAEIISRDFGPDRINWRFDPLSFYEVDGRPFNTLEGFEKIARRLSDLGVTRCITSFYDPYKKVDKRIRLQTGISGPALRFTDPSPEVRGQTIRYMADFLKGLGMTLHLCCENKVLRALEGMDNIFASACIDAGLLKQIFGGNPVSAKDSGQRREKGCQCTRSIDIGSYALHPCRHNCLFCYARTLADT